MSERIEEQMPKALARMAMVLPEGGEPKFFDVPEEVVQELDRRTRKAMDYWRRARYAEEKLATLTAELARRQQQVEALRAACQWGYDLLAKNDNDGAFAFLEFTLAATSDDSWANDGWDLADDVRGATNSTNTTPTAPAPAGEE